jgi:hypothetical protein
MGHSIRRLAACTAVAPTGAAAVHDEEADLVAESR